jgi:WD40-like Beta Propeller Repeat
MEGDRKPFPVVQTNFNERLAQFSPDGRWIAYESNESGRFEVYAQAFPTSGGKWQISTNGGAMARWGRDSKELFYVGLDGRLMATPITVASGGGALQPGTPVPLFMTHIGGAVQGTNRHQYMVSPGQRFLMNSITEEATSPITVILNWRPKS